MRIEMEEEKVGVPVSVIRQGIVQKLVVLTLLVRSEARTDSEVLRARGLRRVEPNGRHKCPHHSMPMNL